MARPVDTVYTYYPNGNIKAVQSVRDGEIVSEFIYLENGSRKHRWDLAKKEVYSYNSFGDQGDASAAYFTGKSPSYTIYQYYGDSPDLLHIERYQNNIRHGHAQYFHRNGQLKAQGEFDNWKKVGFWTYGNESGGRDIQWHIFSPGYYEEGLSIFYTILPFLLTASFLVILGVNLSKRGLYPVYYNITAILPFALFVCWVLAATILDDAGVFLVVVYTATAAMLLLSLINIIWARKLRVKRYVSLLLFLAGLLFGIFLLWLNVMRAITGAMVM